MSIRHTITILCDNAAPMPCVTTFAPKSEKVGEAQTEARAAGWYVGDKTYCPAHVEALGIRVRVRR
jgi:hypothetical protein